MSPFKLNRIVPHHSTWCKPASFSPICRRRALETHVLLALAAAPNARRRALSFGDDLLRATLFTTALGRVLLRALRYLPDDLALIPDGTRAYGDAERIAGRLLTGLVALDGCARRRQRSSGLGLTLIGGLR